MEGIFSAFAVSFVTCLILGPALIPFLRRLKFGQTIREDGPEGHRRKAGTPTMGGILFLVAALLGGGIFKGNQPEIWLLFLALAGFGLIGFLDDFIKVVLKRPLGLKARQKLLGQVLLSLLVAAGAVLIFDRGTGISLPVWQKSFDLGLWYIPFAALVMIATTNAVNLTDGLDGLAAGVTLFAALAYAIIGLMVDMPGVTVFSAALAGSCLGFLRFNAHPAKVFMGDTGSLALGGALSALAILTKTEFVLMVIGGVYVLEALSVIIQVLSFRITGKRVFRMSPIHHHFELIGWHEQKVVLFFWLLGLFFAVLGILSMYNLG